MPTAKKAVKKTAPKKTVKKAVVKKVAAKRTSAPKAVVYENFKLGKETQPFWSFKVTTQTKYWIVLLTVITVLQVWITLKGAEALDILNSINL